MSAVIGMCHEKISKCLPEDAVGVSEGCDGLTLDKFVESTISEFPSIIKLFESEDGVDGVEPLMFIICSIN